MRPKREYSGGPPGWHDLNGEWRTPLYVEDFDSKRRWGKPVNKHDRVLYRWCVRCGLKTPETAFFVLRGVFGAPTACPECAHIINAAGTASDYASREEEP